MKLRTTMLGLLALLLALAACSEAPEPLYRVEAFRLSDATALPDGSMLFLEWHLPDCELGFPFILLRRLHADGELQTITHEIFPGLNPYVYDSQVPRRFLLTPDKAQIIWLGGSQDERLMHINLYDLATGQNVRVTEAQQTDSDTYFAEEDLLRSLHWLST